MVGGFVAGVAGVGAEFGVGECFLRVFRLWGRGDGGEGMGFWVGVGVRVGGVAGQYGIFFEVFFEGAGVEVGGWVGFGFWLFVGASLVPQAAIVVG